VNVSQFARSPTDLLAVRRVAHRAVLSPRLHTGRPSRSVSSTVASLRRPTRSTSPDANDSRRTERTARTRSCAAGIFEVAASTAGVGWFTPCVCSAVETVRAAKESAAVYSACSFTGRRSPTRDGRQRQRRRGDATQRRRRGRRASAPSHDSLVRSQRQHHQWARVRSGQGRGPATCAVGVHLLPIPFVRRDDL
jgi:hypothetical protein